MDADQKQTRDEWRGRSLKRDAENLKNKDRAFVLRTSPYVLWTIAYVLFRGLIAARTRTTKSTHSW